MNKSILFPALLLAAFGNAANIGTGQSHLDHHRRWQWPGAGDHQSDYRCEWIRVGEPACGQRLGFDHNGEFVAAHNLQPVLYIQQQRFGRAHIPGVGRQPTAGLHQQRSISSVHVCGSARRGLLEPSHTTNDQSCGRPDNDPAGRGKHWRV